MREVHVVGVGQTPVGEHWERSLRELGAEAARAAMADAGVSDIGALIVGNMLAGEVCGQQHVGTLIAEHAGLVGIEAVRAEAACGSGGAAVRAGYLHVMSGCADAVLVVGVEKMTDRPGHEVTAGLASAADADYEAQMGLSFVALNALLMRRYMHEYKLGHDEFAPFVINAHENARHNRNAMYPFSVTADEFRSSAMVADPISVLDCSPVCDGAAALLLCSAERARSLRRPSIRIRACTVGTDTLAIHDRRDPLRLDAVARSAHRAYEEGGVRPSELDLFEAHDAFSIMSVLSLEGSGLAEPGHGYRKGHDGSIRLDGALPMSTRGGLKARGHPVGASGVYQIVEVVEQLRGVAGRGQVANARLGMAQSIGGSGATAVTTILESAD